MSLREFNTPKQIRRKSSIQENAIKYKTSLEKWPKNGPEYKMSDELQKIKDEYKTMERKNQEELKLIQNHFGSNSTPDFPDLSDFRKLLVNREPIKNFQILINNEFTGSIDTKRDLKQEVVETKFEKEKLDLMLTTKNEEISFMKKKFLTFTETYKIEAEKLAENEKRTKCERDELKRKLDECQMKQNLQNCFIKELEENNREMKLKLEKANKDIDREIRTLTFDAETEKKRYLANLKKLIELFHIEKIRIDESFSNLSSDIDIEKNQHFQDVEQLKEIIDNLRQEIDKVKQEKALKYAENQKYCLNQKFEDNPESPYQILQEIEEHRKYSHELEMIIKNLGYDNQTLETENAEMKRRYEEKLQQIKEDAEDSRLRLHEELEMFKHKFSNLQEIKAENEYILAENTALKSNLNNIDEKYMRRIRVINVDCNEKQKIMSVEIEKQNLTIEKLNIEHLELKNLIASLEAELTDKSNEYKALVSSKLHIENEKKDLENNLEKSQKLFDEKIAEHEEQVNQIKNLQESEIKSLNSEIARLQKESKDFQTGMIEQETLYKILKVDFDEFVLVREKQQSKFNKEKESINLEFQKKVDELNEQIAELKSINLNYEEIEQDLHKQIQSLVHNINQLNYENKKEVDELKQEIQKQISHDLEELTNFKDQLEEQIKQNKKENALLKTDLQFKNQRCAGLEKELKGLKSSQKNLCDILEEAKERYEDELEQLKLSNDRVSKRSKDEITKLLKEFEQQSLYCDQLEKRKKELEKLNKNYADNLEHVTKVYDREISDLRLDLQNTKTFYENKINHSKNETVFETKKYENRINELEQELQMVKYEVEWLKEAQKE